MNQYIIHTHMGLEALRQLLAATPYENTRVDALDFALMMIESENNTPGLFVSLPEDGEGRSALEEVPVVHVDFASLRENRCPLCFQEMGETSCSCVHCGLSWDSQNIWIEKKK